MNCRKEAYIARDWSADLSWVSKRETSVGEEGNANHCPVEVWLVALGSVCHEGELGYTEDFAMYIFDICLPHVTGGIGEHLQR